MTAIKQCLMCRGEILESKYSTRKKFCCSNCCVKYNKKKRDSLPKNQNKPKRVYSKWAPPIVMG